MSVADGRSGPAARPEPDLLGGMTAGDLRPPTISGADAPLLSAPDAAAARDGRLPPGAHLARGLGRHPVVRLVAQRLAMGFGLLFAVSLLIFLGVEALPGDFAEVYLGQSATPQAIANVREQLGLDRPAPIRYAEWLGNAVTGDFGTSWASGASVSEQIANRLGNTLFLALWAAIISVPLAVFLGMLAVHYRNRLADRLINIVSLTAIALPEFFVGYLLILLFAVTWGWVTFPSTVYQGMPFWERMEAIALPCATLVLVVLAHMMRMTRATILNVMSSAYIETAELKGLGAFRIVARHAAPNAVGPIINVIALNLAYLVVGVVVVEVVFVYPGMGQYMVDAVTVRDMPVVQACGLIFAAVYILLNLTADVLAILANPRLRHPR